MSSLFLDDVAVPGYPAAFSADRAYRYTCWRVWGDAANYCQFLCLNPSTADETNDDPTVRRCISFSKFWGYGAFCMTNIFAFRATDPRVMKSAADPIGPDNDDWILRIASGAAFVVAGWGAHGGHHGRADDVRQRLAAAGVRLHHLGLTNGGQPKHPLYIAGATAPAVLGL